MSIRLHTPPEPGYSAGRSPIKNDRKSTINSPAKPNWFQTHWRGEASLGISYWLNGMLLGSVLPGVIVLGYSVYHPLRHHLRIDALVTLILIALQLSLWVWLKHRARQNAAAIRHLRGLMTIVLATISKTSTTQGQAIFRELTLPGTHN